MGCYTRCSQVTRILKKKLWHTINYLFNLLLGARILPVLKDNKQLCIYNTYEIRKTIPSAAGVIKIKETIHQCKVTCVCKSGLMAIILWSVACKQLPCWFCWCSVGLQWFIHSYEPCSWHSRTRPNRHCRLILASIVSFICSFRLLTNNKQDYCNIYWIY